MSNPQQITMSVLAAADVDDLALALHAAVARDHLGGQSHAEVAKRSA